MSSDNAELLAAKRTEYRAKQQRIHDLLSDPSKYITRTIHTPGKFFEVYVVGDEVIIPVANLEICFEDKDVYLEGYGVLPTEEFRYETFPLVKHESPSPNWWVRIGFIVDYPVIYIPIELH